MKTLEIEARDGTTYAGVLEDGRLTDLFAERADRPSAIGAIHLARVDRVDPGSAFLDIAGRGGDERSAYLPLRNAERPAIGDLVPVQITGDARDGKRVEATRDVALAGAWLVHLPFGRSVAVPTRLGPAARREWRDRLSGGWIVRAAAAGAELDAVLAEGARLAESWRGIAARAAAADAPMPLHPAPGVARRALLDHPDAARILIEPAELRRSLARWLEAAAPPLAERVAPGASDLAEAAAALLDPVVALPSGGSIAIEATRALTAIDVDAGRSRDPVEANREAAREIARQLRLRNIGGIVVVDFISMRRGSDRAAVLAAFREALAGDPLRLAVGETLSPLGLAELARERRGAALAEVLDG